MSTLRKRNGKWQVQVRRTGCPHTSKSFNSKTDAAEWARLMEVRADSRELNRGFRALESVTLQDVLTRYLAEVVALKRCKANESIIVKALSRQSFCQQTLNSLSASHVATYRDQRLRNVKPVTVNRELALLQHALDIAINEWNLPLNFNPVKRVKRPRNGDHRDRRLQFGEFRKLQISIKRCRNPIMRPLVLFALVTGMDCRSRQSVRRDCHFNIASIADSNSTHAFRSVIERTVKESSRANWRALSRFLLHLPSRFVLLVNCLMVPPLGLCLSNKSRSRLCSYYVL